MYTPVYNISIIYAFPYKTEMKYISIKEKLKKLRVFSLNDVYLVDPSFRQATLYDWENQGRVKKIRNTWYVFGDFKPSDLDYYLIANRIYSPSYISLELALNHYGVIPEAVNQISSVSTEKTNDFDTPFGRFTYKSIKEELFWGYKIIERDNIGIRIASLEKAILDTLYLNSQIATIEDFEGLRYNRQILRENLDLEVFKKYRDMFDSKRMSETVEVLFEYMKSDA